MIKNKCYKNFSLRIHDKGARKPIVGQFELTHRCNLHCRHCYIVNDADRKELSFKELRRIMDEVYAEGCLWLCLTGGEPLLRKDFMEIYSYAYKKGFIITIFTNATLLNEEIVKSLTKFPPFCIEVTLNGVTKNTYELITRARGSFEKAMLGIELVRRYKLPLKLKRQAMILNIDEFTLMRKLHRKTGINFESSYLIDPRMDGSVEPCFLRLPPEKLGRLRKIKDIMREGDGLCTSSSSNKLFHCPGGTWMFYVNPFGGLFFCNSLRNPSWDLRHHPFRPGFYDFFPQIRAMEFKSNSPCKRCYLRLRNLCVSCPGRALLETGDMEAPIPYYCELAKRETNRQ